MLFVVLCVDRRLKCVGCCAMCDGCWLLSVVRVVSRVLRADVVL